MKFNVPINAVDIIILLVLAVLFVLGIRIVIGFFKPAQVTVPQDNANERFKSGSHIVVTIDGMMCGMCENHMKDAIRAALPKVKIISSSYKTGRIEFILPGSFTGKELCETLRAKIDPTGYRLLEIECIKK